MEKRKWLWKRRSSLEKSPGGSESPESFCSHSERSPEDQEAAKVSPNHHNQSPEVALRATDGPSFIVNGKPHSLMQKLLEADKDNDTQSDDLGMEIMPDRALEETTSSATSNGSLDQKTVAVTSVSTTNGTLNQNSQSGEVTSITTSDSSSNSIPKLEEATTLVGMLIGSLNQHCQSVEGSSKSLEENENVKLLTEKLSAALVNVSIKDELVKQHSRVAEEAVAGWEKAEKEVAGLKQQIEAALQQKTATEARVSQLDEALKECVRQLRLSKEEQERKISQALAEKAHEFDLTKSKLEAQLIEIQGQLEASSRANSAPLVDFELLQKLSFLEEENIALKQELLSQSEELEVRTIERDLSTKAAEMASKQHLESIKKVAKLEAECRRLKNLSARRKPAIISDQKKFSTTCSSSVESVILDGQSDNGDSMIAMETDSQKNEKNGSWANALVAELGQFKNDKAAVSRHSLPASSSVEIDLMDDFLEMERLASMPQSRLQHGSETKPTSNLENQLKIELGTMRYRISELEERLEKVEAEKSELEITLVQTKKCLEKSQVELIETRMKLEQLEVELHEANALKLDLESNMNDLKLEAQAMSSKIKLLDEEIDRHRIFAEELSTKCQELESDIKRKSEELELHHQNMDFKDELEEKTIALAECQKSLDASQIQLGETKAKLGHLEKELEEANMSKQEANALKLDLDSNMSDLKLEAEAMSLQIKQLYEEIDTERIFSEELSTKCQELESDLKRKNEELELHLQNITFKDKLKESEMALVESQEQLQASQAQLVETKEKLEQLEKELQEANESKQEADALKLDLESNMNFFKLDAEAKSLKIKQLYEEIDREKIVSEELSTKCQQLESDLKRKNEELELHHQNIAFQDELKEKEMALAESQKCLEELQIQLVETKEKSDQLEKELVQANESKQQADALKLDLESNMTDLKLEAQATSLKIKKLSEEIDRERSFSEELSTKCQKLESDLERKNEELALHHQSIAFEDELKEKEMALAESQKCLEASQVQLVDAKTKLEQLEKELGQVNGSKEQLESDLDCTREQIQKLSTHVNSLQAQIDKEHALSADLSARCQGLENKLLQKKQELAILRNALSNNEPKIKQEDLDTAAGKLAECQKTIASLGNQLKSLATLEDFLIDTASIPGFSRSAPLIAKAAGGETWKFHSNNVYLPKKEIGASPLEFQEEDEGELHTFSKYTNGLTPEPSVSPPSLLFNDMGSEIGNPYRKSFPPWKG